MTKTSVMYLLVSLTLLSTMVLSACGPSDGDATPTLAPEEVQTQAVLTFAAGLTQTEMARPTDTPTPSATPTHTETSTPAAANTVVIPAVPGSGSVPVSSCNSMAFVSDVTIPDNTSMKPGEVFTKTWRVRNNGTCAWEAGFKFNFTGGNAMGTTAVTLTQIVGPGAETELSVAMTAPSTAGTHRSNWRMSTASGAYFGDEVYVAILVSGSGLAATTGTTTVTGSPAATTETPTETATATPTETPVP